MHLTKAPHTHQPAPCAIKSPGTDKPHGYTVLLHVLLHFRVHSAMHHTSWQELRAVRCRRGLRSPMRTGVEWSLAMLLLALLQ